MMKARTLIERRIKNSKDETLGKGTYFHSRSYLGFIGFPDIMDILLYHLSLQPDLKKIAAGVKMKDFWQETVQAHWEKRYKMFPHIKEVPWADGPGPMGGTMGTAEYYLIIYPGVCNPGVYNFSLLEYFRWPGSLADEKRITWPRYKRVIEDRVFPKFRRKKHQKKLAAALDFAEEICQKLREATSQKVALT